MLVNVMVQDHVCVYIGYYDNGFNPYVCAYWMIPWENPNASDYKPHVFACWWSHDNHMCMHVGEGKCL